MFQWPWVHVRVTLSTGYTVHVAGVRRSRSSWTSSVPPRPTSPLPLSAPSTAAPLAPTRGRRWRRRRRGRGRIRRTVLCAAGGCGRRRGRWGRRCGRRGRRPLQTRAACWTRRNRRASCAARPTHLHGTSTAHHHTDHHTARYYTYDGQLSQGTSSNSSPYTARSRCYGGVS